MLFTYTEMRVWNQNQNLIYLFSLSYIESEWFQSIVLLLFKKLSFLIIKLIKKYIEKRIQTYTDISDLPDQVIIR